MALRQWGMRRSIAASALADGVLLPIWGFWGAFSLLQSEGRSAEHALHMSFDEMVPHFGMQIVIYAVSIGGVLGLLRRRSVPAGLAPARGVWAQRLAALLFLFGLYSVLTADIWPFLLLGPGLDRLLTMLVLLAAGLYLAPLWQVLVRGWLPAPPQRLSPSERAVTH